MNKKFILIVALAAFAIGVLIGNLNIIPAKPPAPETTAEKPVVQAAGIPYGNLNEVFVKVAEKVKPAVVEVLTRAVVTAPSPFGDLFNDPFFRYFFRDFAPPERKEVVSGLGSGFIISPDGYVVTNYHVVKGAEKVTVKLSNGDEYEAKIVGTDEKTELALLKIDAKGLPYLTWGDSSKIRVGEWVLAIGNPFGYEYTVTAGIISAKGRQLDLAEYSDFIQTDAAINRGNSGGPLVNLKGEVIGINTAIAITSNYAPVFSGIGFAIPSNIAKKVINDLKTKGRVERGYLGVYLQNVNEKIAKFLKLPVKHGALVTDVEKGSPADKAGLKRYDVIIKFNGEEIKNITQLKIKVVNTAPGTPVTLTIIRNGKEKEVKVVLGSLGKASRVISRTNLGIEVEPIPPNLRKYGYTKGVMVSKVVPGSPADRAGIRPGDIIIEVNRVPVKSVAEFNSLVSRLKKGDVVLLTLMRGRMTYIVTLEVK